MASIKNIDTLYHEDLVMKLSEKEMNIQIRKEAMISLALYGAFFLWWYFTGYGMGSGDPKEFSYIFGLPMWFFLSSVVGYVLFCIAAIVVVKCFFKNFDLGEEAVDSEEA